MGFGWLFIGYFFTVMNMQMFGIAGTLIRIFGLMLMVLATLKLRKYNASFNVTLVGITGMLCISVLVFTISIDRILFENLLIGSRFFSSTAEAVIEYSGQVVTFAFNATLLWGVLKIAKETDIDKIANNAIRNFVFFCIYYFVYALSFVPTEGIQSAKAEFALITWILYFICSILNIVLLFSCYARICDEADLEMERKPSRFEFVNKFREKQDKRSEQARLADEAYRRERRERRAQRKKKK